PAAAPPQRHRDFVIEHASEEPTSPTLDAKGAPADIETFDGTLDFNAVAHNAAKADGIEVQEEVELKPQDLVVEGLAHTQYESGIFATPPGTAEPGDEPRIDLPLIMPDDLLESPAPPAPPAPAACCGRALRRRWRCGHGRAVTRRAGAHRDDGRVVSATGSSGGRPPRVPGAPGEAAGGQATTGTCCIAGGRRDGGGRRRNG